jgi:hypothetical protein
MLNYTIPQNVTLECTQDIIENTSIYVCRGQISVIPYNQDVLIVLLTIIAVCIVLITVLKIWEKIG